MIRRSGLLRIITIIGGGLGILILSQLYRIYIEPRFRLSDAYLLFNCAIVAVITVSIIRTSMRSSEWQKASRILIVGSIGVFGAASTILLSLSLFLLGVSASLAETAALTAASCGGVWLISLLIFFIVKAKIAQERFAAQRQSIK
jgi:hypothetical protein